MLVSAVVTYHLSNVEEAETAQHISSIHKIKLEKSLVEQVTIDPIFEKTGKGDVAFIEEKSEEKLAKKKEKKKKLTKVEKFRMQFANMGVTDLTDCDDEALSIFKKASTKAKIKGYLPDGSVMTIEKKKGKWYRVKSGKITGYVQKKYVVGKKEVEKTVMENEYMTAHIVKNSVPVKNQAKNSGITVGMGYQGGEYPIVEFSKNNRYVMIQRTETIAGWVPVSKISLKMTAPTAMTKEEFEEYQEEQELKEQQALQSYMNLKVSSTGNPLQDKIIKLIAHNESGNYKAARNPITSGEKTITVGAWQWYGENAHGILKQICAANPAKSKSIIEGVFSGKKGKEKAKELYQDIISGGNWEGSRRIFTTKELIAIKELLGSGHGVQVQNARIHSDIQAKVRVAISSYRLTNDALAAYFCDLFWQNPQNARKIVNECIKHYKSAKKFSEAEDGLRFFHKTALKNGVMGKYSRRRAYSYYYCKGLQ